ncbi:unnamed protein product [Vicia faba]|uniref:BAH domain-containing protein n=1 Tax=Vicia faba TaxID=3906 RepID=A0AAV0Z1D0_VICFA|nr:unnamed protein product [Vicia faba]
MSSDEVDPVFVAWEEQVICQERGNRVIHFYLKHVSGNSVLAVVGTERSVRHMMYVVPQQFLQAYGSINVTYKWRARREVVDWLNHLVLKNQLRRADAMLDGSEKALGSGSFDMYANNRKIPDKQISKKLNFQSSNIEWSGTAWFCAKSLKHYSGFDRKGTTIYVHSFVYIMAEDENPYLGYLEDMYEDKKKQKRVKVRWFHRGQEVKHVIPDLDLEEGEVFITPNVQVISAECVNGPATVLTPKHYEKYKAELLPHTSLPEIHICFRQLKNNKLKPFALTKLRGYSNQPILSDLNSPSHTPSKRKTNYPKLEDGENFTQDDPLRYSNKRDRSSVEYSVPENGLSGLQYSSPMNEMSKDSGIRGCWFRCTILYASQKKLKVQYDDLMDADDEGLLEEWLPASRVANPDKLGMRCYGRLTVRPRPPEFSKGCTFEVGAAVDAWCGDGWWESVITAVNVSEAETYQLYSPGEEKYMSAKKDNIRIAQDWIDDKWVDILGKPDICSIIASNSGSQTKLSSNSAVVEGSMTGSSATLESPSPVARVEVTPKVEQESSGSEPFHYGGMKRLTLWKPPLHAIHEDEDIDPSGFDADTDEADDELLKSKDDSGSSSDDDGGDGDGTDNDGDDDADNSGDDSEDNFSMDEKFDCSEPKLDAAGAIHDT